jgi:hypothetical protein
MQEQDHSKWLLVSDQPRAHDIDISNWDDKLAGQPGICHLCCTDHLHVLVGSWMLPDLGIQEQDSQPDADDNTAMMKEFNFDRACLSSGLETDRESLLAMLEAVEVVLKSSAFQAEEKQPVFDA